MKKLVLSLIFIFPQLLNAQSNDCSTATPFCTGTNYSFPASTNTLAPIGPYYDCLFTQPNPAFFYLEIDQPGNITINMQSTPTADIDFICWGPFNDPNTMCDSLTAAYVEDCSYSPAAIEICDITNAVTGQFYVLLITNYSNVNCNIDFSQTSGNGTTNCCLLGDAGQDNNFIACNSDPLFIMENELNGSPSSGGTWYDPNWNIFTNNIFDPATGTNGTYAYLVQGTPVSGSSVVCPDDTAFLTIDISSCFDIVLIATEASCLGNDASITCGPDTLLPSWQCELYDMAGTNLGIVPNLNTSSYTFYNLFPGTYMVKILDNLGGSAEDIISVGQVPTSISVVSNPVGVTCYNGDDGQIGVWVSGGLLPYSFYIDGVLSTNAYPYDSLFQNLLAGTYVISVIDDNNCMIRDTVDIPVPLYPLQALASSKVAVCYGSDLGIAVGSSAGGTPAYSYEWFDSGMNSFSTNDTAFGLSAGSYYLKVMDSNGCDTFTTVNVIEPQIPLSASPQVFNVSCKGDSTGMIVGDASGSWAPYTYYWLNMQGDTLQESDTHISTRDTLFDLLVGSYQLHIEDFEGCTVDYVFNISEPDDALSIDSMKVISAIACYGDSVGIARLYVSGGDPLYSYLWDNGENGIIANSLTSGYHTASLTDDWGCEVLDSIYIPENTLIESDLVVDTTVSCYGASDGIVSISSLGGASSIYTYFWSQGQQTVGVNADTVVGLLHGSYYVTTRDILGCEVVDSVYVSQPDPLIMEASELDWIDCFGYNNGEAFAVAQSGTSPYTFIWMPDGQQGDTVNTLNPGVATVEVTDARGCIATDTIFTHEPDSLYINIDDSQTVLPYCLGVNTASLSALAGGGTPSYTYEWDDNLVQPQTTTTATALLADTYTITVTDIKGCTASDTRTISNTNTIGASVSSLLTYIGGNNISCYGEDDGKALVAANGGHAPYSYQWYGPNGYVSINDTISNLLAGVYSVTVRDTNDCMVNSSIIITEPANIFFTTLGATDESCLGACDGEIQVNVLGGVSPYLAMATETTTGNVITIVMGVGNDSVVTGLCSGTYVLTFTDENGCSSTLINGGVNQRAISTNNTTVAQINSSNIIPILCNGDSTGVLEVLNPNINAGYTYSWQDLNGNMVSNTTTASNLLAGTYVLYADYNTTTGCTTTDTATVTELPIINPSAVVTHVDCYGNATGMLQGSVQGGTFPYSMLWNPGGIGDSTASGLQAGSYTLTITDINNCQEVDTFEVTQPQALLASIDSTGYVLTASVPAGGTALYSYSWREQLNTLNEIGTGLTYVVNSYGTYYVVITDANGCESASNVITYEAGALGTLDLKEIHLSVYPNPFIEETTVDFGQTINKATITIVDVYGKLIEIHELTDTDKYIIKRTNKASGIYFVEIEINKEHLNTIKLIIE